VGAPIFALIYKGYLGWEQQDSNRRIPIFKRFNAPKEKILGHYIEATDAILNQWPKNPIAEDLRSATRGFLAILTCDS
jgi:hypothetical protein